MATTVKRITLALSKEQMRELDHLAQVFGETYSDVVKRGIISLYNQLMVITASSSKLPSQPEE